MKGIDHESPKSISVDMISSRVFAITDKGLFIVWDLATLDQKYSKNYYKPSKAVISFRFSNKVMIVFENEIIVVDSNPTASKYDELVEYKLALNPISDVKLNYSENLLAVATYSASAPDISIFEVNYGFKRKTNIVGFKTAIKHIDFSTDNKYLQCEDNLGESWLIEIDTKRVIHTEAGGFELEWLGDGLRSNPDLKGIHYYYGQSNKIT